MVNNIPPFKVDLAGSFLAPQSLKDAREQYRNQQITLEDLRAIEDEEIRNLVDRLKAIGLKVVTDGRFRDPDWPMGFLCALDGIVQPDLKKRSIKLIRKIDVHRHPVVQNFMFLTGITGGDVIAKVVIPAPSSLLSRIIKDGKPEEISHFYPDFEVLCQDIVRIYNRIIAELYESGCRYIQFDDSTRIISGDAILVNNIVLKNIPEDLYVAFYAPAEMLVSLTGVNAFFLDYDAECCGKNKLLWFIKEREAAFGFIPSHYPDPDEVDEFRAKIEEVIRYIPLARLSMCVPNAQVLPSESYDKAEQKQWYTLETAIKVAAEL